MNTNKMLLISFLFILATLSYIVGSNMISQNFLLINTNQAINSTSMIIGMVLEFVNIVSVIAIGNLFHSILKHYKSHYSRIYLISRIIEGFFLVLSLVVIAPLLLASNTMNSTTLMNLYSVFFQIGMISLSIGSLFLLTLLNKVQFAPKTLCRLGFIGYVALLVSSTVTLLLGSSLLVSMLYIPGALFEIIFPIYLIIKAVKKTQLS